MLNRHCWSILSLVAASLACAESDKSPPFDAGRPEKAALEKDARNPPGLDAVGSAAGEGGWARVICDPKTGMEFVLVPSGSFPMGSANGNRDEQPVHPVEISRPFYLARTEVTQGQWVKVMGANPSRFKKGANYPVEQVSWDDAKNFLTRLRKVQGWRFDFPTEAQWEYACRAKSTTEWSFGDDEGRLDAYAWYDKNSGQSTHPVAQKRPNGWGLFDMHGNVWEWCRDWYDKDYYGKRAAKDPTGPSGGEFRVLRGGSWSSPVRNPRSAIRFGDTPDFRSDVLGFRPALVPTG